VCYTEELSFDTLSRKVCCILIPSLMTSAICLELQISFGTEMKKRRKTTERKVSKYQDHNISIEKDKNFLKKSAELI